MSVSNDLVKRTATLHRPPRGDAWGVKISLSKHLPLNGHDMSDHLWNHELVGSTNEINPAIAVNVGGQFTSCYKPI